MGPLSRYLLFINILPFQLVCLLFWLSSILFVFYFGHQHFGRLPFWSSSILVVFYLNCLPFWSSSILVVSHFGRLPFCSSSFFGSGRLHFLGQVVFIFWLG